MLSHKSVDGLKLVPAGQIGAEDVAAPSHISVVGLKLVPAGQAGGTGTANAFVDASGIKKSVESTTRIR